VPANSSGEPPGPPTSAGRRAIALAALAVSVLSVFLVHDHTRGDSLSADEPVHILSGYLDVFARNAIVNIEHPPLMKILAGIALRTLPLAEAPARVPMGLALTGWGHDFFFRGPVPPDAIFAAARAPFLLLLALLLGTVFFWARKRYGGGAALLAVALLAFDPNMVAHAGVVHTDLGAALTFLLAVIAWDNLRRAGPSAGRVAAAAGALGCALLTKFSAVYLLPILLLQGLLAARKEARPGKAIGRMLVRLGLVVAGAVAAVFLVYAVVTSRMDRADQRAIIHELVALRGAPGLSRVVEEIARVSPPLGHYLGGLASVARQNAQGGGVNFLFGNVSVTGFPFYFFVAFFAKSTLAFLAVTALSLLRLARDPESRSEAALLLLPVGVLFLASIGSSYNIGIRHMLPVYPFLALAGASLFARARRKAGGRAAVWLLAALPVVSAAEIARIHPHELSYFNPLVGGPEHGRRILSDSNVDWGLDLKRLAAEVRRRGISDATVAYFGGDDVGFRMGMPDFLERPALRGRLVAVSTFYLAEGPQFLRYQGTREAAAVLEALLAAIAAGGRPAGRVGYSIELFELPPLPAPSSPAGGIVNNGR
jgi:4-amino-4-deoxy-L-arabinose transferase-like glycosyltransferase